MTRERRRVPSGFIVQMVQEKEGRDNEKGRVVERRGEQNNCLNQNLREGHLQ